MKFRKKPVVIEALQYEGTWESYSNIMEFVGKPVRPDDYGLSWPKLLVLEANGSTMAILSINDWIIKDMHGEFHQYKQDIFNLTYEKEES